MRFGDRYCLISVAISGCTGSSQLLIGCASDKHIAVNRGSRDSHATFRKRGITGLTAE
jgi:hypothetical protein